MRDIASTLREHWLEAAWGAFSLVNLALIPRFGEWETVPFHFIWVSLTLLYGLRVWRPASTAWVVATVSATTGAALLWMAAQGRGEVSETSEVPLMAGMFLAMVWHARRRQRAMEDVRRAAEREREFVRDASHQLRTPVTIARSHAELIRDGHCGDAPTEDAHVILEELQRLGTISDRLLLLAAAELPEFLRVEDVDFGELIANTGRRWRASAERTWRVAATADGLLLADPVRLSSALDALLENAVKFTRDGDAISILGRTEGSWALIEISDEGIGIPGHEHGRIFERFAQGEASDRGHGGARGTGLGLAIVKAIVESHGGSVGVDSSPGRGSTFTIRLPGLQACPPDLESEPATLSTARLAGTATGAARARLGRR